MSQFGMPGYFLSASRSEQKFFAAILHKENKSMIYVKLHVYLVSDFNYKLHGNTKVSKYNIRMLFCCVRFKKGNRYCLVSNQTKT